MNIPVRQARRLALMSIDEAAAAALQRFKGGAPEAKLAQARAFVAARALDAQAPAPAYVALEAQLRGVGALALANAIAEGADLVEGTIGPQIERERIAGLLAVAGADGADDEARRGAIEAARAAAVQAIAVKAGELLEAHPRFKVLTR